MNPVKKLRETANLTQAEMAEKLSEKQQSISRYENGNSNITLMKYLKWCSVLGVTDFNKLFK
tara:strand:- start:8813 stop:8998 length:186 start_codon:yes stop_codon:yes gene_type:complete